MRFKEPEHTKKILEELNKNLILIENKCKNKELKKEDKEILVEQLIDIQNNINFLSKCI